MGIISSALLSTTLYAKDYTGHWAEATIDAWYNRGVIAGEGEGIFNPTGSVTRAQLAAFIDRLFIYDTPSTPVQFTDVLPGSWYTHTVNKVVNQGVLYIPGTAFGPNTAATRQEVAYALAQAYQLTPTKGAEIGYTDYTDIASWALDSVQALAQMGYISGYPDGSFGPQNPVTRAEVISMIDRLTKNYINTPGTYTQVASGNIVINSGGVSLKDVVVDGNIYIAPGVDQGEVDRKSVV